MDELKRRILRDGIALNERVLMVDSFLNHQVDPGLMAKIGAEFAYLARDLGITRVVTIESSGIAPAQMTALALNVPMVILKKSASVTLKEGVVQTEVFSFTKNAAYQLTLKEKYIKPDDRVLLVDDFLANGEAAIGASKLIERAGGKIAAIGIVIEKSFQPGRALLDGKGFKVFSLARISRLAEGTVQFLDGEPKDGETV